MSFFNELYASYSNKNEELRNKAIAYGNSSYILINERNPEYVDKIYINGYKIYGEKAIQQMCYTYGFENEYKMYNYTNNYDFNFVVKMLNYDLNKVSITLEYLKDYVTLKSYLDDCIKSNYVNQKIIFQTLMNLLKNMENVNFVHNNLSLTNIMINPDNMDIKVIDLKEAYIFNNKIHKNVSIFNFTKNDLLFQIYKYLYTDIDLFYTYFKFRNPDYYLKDNNKVGDFYYIGLSQLFDEHIDFLDKFNVNPDLRNYVESVIYFNNYVHMVSNELPYY